jgi:hypothetical protein
MGAAWARNAMCESALTFPLGANTAPSGHIKEQVNIKALNKPSNTKHSLPKTAQNYQTK